MDDVRVGRIARALRRRLEWRQSDLADRAGCDQTTISLIERGYCAGLRLALVRRVFQAMGASFDGSVTWRAGDIDRLLDVRHAAIVEAVVAVLRRSGWDVLPEVTYSEWGERGSIDILAWRSDRRAIAVFEIKSDLTVIGDTVRKHDEKTRLAVETLALRRLGWRPATVGRILVVGDDRTARRRFDAHRTTFEAAYPLASRAIRQWLHDPVGEAAGAWFLTVTNASRDGHKRGGPRRVRVPRAPATPASAARIEYRRAPPGPVPLPPSR